MLTTFPIRQDVAEANMGTEFPIVLLVRHLLTSERTLGFRAFIAEIDGMAKNDDRLDRNPLPAQSASSREMTEELRDLTMSMRDELTSLQVFSSRTTDG